MITCYPNFKKHSYSILQISIFVISMSFNLTSLSAQNNKDAFLNFNSPHNTIYTHLKSLSQENYNIERAGEAINLEMKNEKEARKLAIKLKQIYDSKGLLPRYSKIPKDPNYVDSLTHLQRYIPFKDYPEIYLEKVGHQWLYSSETAESIPELHQSIFRFGTDRFLSLLPKGGSIKILGILLWQIYGILIIIGVSLIFHRLLRWLFDFIFYRIVKRIVNPDAAKKYFKPLSKPFTFIPLFLIILLLIPVLQFPAKVTNILFILCKVGISVYAMIMVYRIVDVFGAYLLKIAQKTESSMDDQLAPLVTRILKIFVVIIGVLFILQNLDFNITALLAGLSIGGLALALAAQDTVKNFFGSMMIFIDKPFQIGDWIMAENVDGTVEEVGFRSTRIRTFENSLITIPNGTLANISIDNMGMRIFRRFKTHLTITYDTPPDKIEMFIEGLRGIIKTHPSTRKDYFIVELNEFGASSINILFQIYFTAPDYPTEARYRHEILLSIMKLAEKLGVRWAFPTQTLFIEEFPGQNSLSPKHNQSREQQKSIVSTFLNHFRQLMDKQNLRPPMKVQPKTPQEQSRNQGPFDKRIEIEKPKPQPAIEKKEVIDKTPEEIRKNTENNSSNSDEKTTMIVKKGKELTENEIYDAAKELKIEISALRAIIEIQSKTKGFLADGKPSITFHGHKFWQILVKKNIDPLPLQVKYPEVVYPKWTKKFIKTNEKEYERLEKAKSIDKEAAYLSTTWGMFQVSGSEYKNCGFNTVHEMVFKLYQTEKEQLQAFSKLLISRNVIEDIKEKNWAQVAKKLNGPLRLKSDIDQKLEKAFQKYSGK